MRYILDLAIWLCIFEILDFIPHTVFGSRFISLVLYMVAFYIIEMILMLITTKKHTVVIASKAEKVRRGLFGTFTRRIIKTSEGNILECVNDWPLFRDTKQMFAQLKIGKKYQITTCRPLLINPVRWIRNISEIKTTKRKTVKNKGYMMRALIFVCVLFVIALLLLGWGLDSSQNMWVYILGFLVFLLMFGEIIWNMHKQTSDKKIIKKQILLFVFMCIPAISVLFFMNKIMPHMEHLNMLVVGLLVFFLYVYFTFESAIITVKKTEIKRHKSKVIKQIISSDGECFEVWNGFTRLFKSNIMEAHTSGQYVEMLPRITDEQFKKIKPGQRYRVKTFRLIGVDRYIWSMKKVRANRKKLK